jgi:gluconokinase
MRARAALAGLSLATTATDVLAAALESVAFGLAAIYERLEPLATEGHQIVCSGGALVRSRAFTQMIANALGRSLTLSVESEASSRGVALLVLEALGMGPSIASLPPAAGEQVRPDPKAHDRARSAMARRRELYRKLIDAS